MAVHVEEKAATAAAEEDGAHERAVESDVSIRAEIDLREKLEEAIDGGAPGILKDASDSGSPKGGSDDPFGLAPPLDALVGPGKGLDADLPFTVQALCQLDVSPDRRDA